MAHISQQSIGSQVFRFDELASSNDMLRELMEKNLAAHGAVVSTRFQTKGRGQAGNTWESEPGQNLMLSTLILPKQLAADEQVYLNLMACLSVFDFVNAHFPDNTFIKWPNDIYVMDKKIAGILIENSLQGSVIKSSIVGIGINVNQKTFSTAKASSLSILDKKEFNVDECIKELLMHTNKRYNELCLHLKDKLMADYLNVLYRKEEQADFFVGNEKVSGIIKGIDETGRLKVEINNVIQFFNNKEISYL